MRKISIFTIWLLINTTTFAQRTLRGEQEIISPEIHGNNTVTFRLNAPQATGVEITGDFLPEPEMQTPTGGNDAQGVAELIKHDNGVWEYTTPAPLSPELYSYTFTVDGVRVIDPANVYAIRNENKIYSIFIIGGSHADLYKANNVPHGTVSRRWYNSPSLNMDRRITIYTPAGYEQSKEEYPVFYLLHGAGGDEDSWTTFGRASHILDNLIAQGKAQPMIVVMTNGNSGQQSAPGESANGMYKPSFTDYLRMDGEFEKSFPDVVHFIENNYRVKTDKANRAIAGLSMGGFHSLHISKQYPDLFDYVGLFSAVVNPREDMTSEVYQNTDEKLKVQFAQNPKIYYIAIGATDFLFDANVAFRKRLDENKYPYVYYENGGGHIWKNWRIYLAEFAQMLFK
ncbi:MAG: esterase [Dysgonamonadaceae bacterium]|jgi:enterochelin esterase family protein|nr:esterase [Dysgonamonadaceae bacterium]